MGLPSRMAHVPCLGTLTSSELPQHDVTDDDYKAWQKQSQCLSYAGAQNTHPQTFREFCQERYPGTQIRETYGHPDDPGFPAVNQRSDSSDDSLANN